MSKVRIARNPNPIRNYNGIICAKNIAQYINLWMGGENLQVEDFAKMLEELGFKAPIEISSFSKAKRTFFCLDSEGKNFKLHFEYGFLFPAKVDILLW